jgi:HAD superfamily hydrolase (TIGR01509 family)
MEKIHANCRPMFHHEYALSKLCNQGYKIAVCSNSVRKTIEEMMDFAHLREYLDLIVSNEDVVKSKPDPEMYDFAIRQFGFRPEECLVVEDNPVGVQAGKASGAHVLQVVTVYDVNYRNIMNKIKECEKAL